MSAALGLVLALAAAAPAASADVPTYRPAGAAKAECRGGLNFGMSSMVRTMVGCQLVAARKIEFTAPDLEAEFRRVTTSRVGRADVKSVADEQLRRWATDPRTSLAPRQGFRPTQVKDLEYAETSGYANFINPTGGAGLVAHEATGLVFRGRLVAETDAGPVEAPISGKLILDRGSWMFTALSIVPAADGK